MKKITLALPALAAAVLSISACAKPDDGANNSAASDVVLNDETVLNEEAPADGNLGADALADNASEPENAAIGENATIGSGNSL